MTCAGAKARHPWYPHHLNHPGCLRLYLDALHVLGDRPLLCAVGLFNLVFYGPFFITNVKHLVPFESVTGLLYAAAILSHPLSVATIFALIISLGAWFMVILPTTREKYWNFVYANLAQLVTIVLIYWT